MSPAIRCLLGGALGDALGLPAEGMGAARIARMWPGEWKHRFFFGRGMVSDDTEHAVMTTLSLAAHGDPSAFAHALAGKLRWWFAGIPAGIGLATARSILKLWCGVPPERGGVRSAGNGPLMRAAVIGVWYHDQPEARIAFVDASTRITHTDPRAFEAARIVAEAAAFATPGHGSAGSLLERITPFVYSAEMKLRFSLLREFLSHGKSVREFADAFGRKAGYVSGFAPDTAAVALYAWLRHRGDFRRIITSVITAGGDTDTVGFLAGSLAGIETEPENIPPEWLAGLRDHPIRRKWLEHILSSPLPRYPNWPLSLVRNFIFLLIILTHAFRRLLPPY